MLQGRRFPVGFFSSLSCIESASGILVCLWLFPKTAVAGSPNTAYTSPFHATKADQEEEVDRQTDRLIFSIILYDVLYLFSQFCIVCFKYFLRLEFHGIVC